MRWLLPGTLPIALLLVTGLGLGSALPSTPGYIGIYQFVAVSVLTPFGFTKTNAIAYILLSQALQYALITFWGALGMARSRGGPPGVSTGKHAGKYVEQNDQDERVAQNNCVDSRPGSQERRRLILWLAIC